MSVESTIAAPAPTSSLPSLLQDDPTPAAASGGRPNEEAPLEKTKESSAAARKVSMLIRSAEKQIRIEYPIFDNQDAIGMAIWAGSFAIMGVISALYVKGYLGVWPTIFLMAIPISFLHELEHDLIHNLYYKKFPLIQDIMFFGIWLSKLHGSPWFRRDLHLKHHQLSGQVNDAEERLIGLGIPYGFKRMAVTVHPVGAVLVTGEIAADAKYLDVNRMNMTSLPVIAMYIVLTKLFLAYSVAFWLFPNGVFPFWLPLPMSLWPIVRDLCVCLAFPNTFRQACLMLMSNSSHYYGDIPQSDVFYQNQIIDHPIVWPFQALCFNFGATHILHHYVVPQPFYLRQLVYQRVADGMVALGVRRNDFGSLWRGNRYVKPKDEAERARGQQMGMIWFVLFATVGLAAIVVFDTLIAIKTAQKFVRFGEIVLGYRKRRGDGSEKQPLEALNLDYDKADGSAANAPPTAEEKDA